MKGEHKCEWCESFNGTETSAVVHWELPDGSRAITITNVPSYHCNQCNFTYQSEELIKTIEDQLFLISTKTLGSTISYEELMKQPRLLKKNYFDFSNFN